AVVMVALTVIAAYNTWHRYRTPLSLVSLFAFLFVVGLLGWVGAGGRVPVVYLATGAIAFAVPVVLGALAGVIGERAGILNIAIEGQLLIGAFLAAVVGSVT